MLKYILRRMGYSVFIIIGVVMMTFVLFRMGAGDPAAAALGKDARPQEIDSLRKKLGSDLPLFFGYLCRSEAYSSRILPQEVVFTRNFPDEGVVLRVKSNCRKWWSLASRSRKTSCAEAHGCREPSSCSPPTK